MINGWEVVNAYSELIDPIDQMERFRSQLEAREMGDMEAMETDEEFVTCMEYGMPPMSGWGMGIDRFVALLTEYQKAPEIIRERMYLETMGEVLGKTNKVLVDVENGNSLMYLPLDKLANKSSAAAEDSSGMSRSELDRVSRQASDALSRSQSNDSSNSIRREGRQ